MFISFDTRGSALFARERNYLRARWRPASSDATDAIDFNFEILSVTFDAMANTYRLKATKWLCGCECEKRALLSVINLMYKYAIHCLCVVYTQLRYRIGPDRLILCSPSVHSSWFLNKPRFWSNIVLFRDDRGERIPLWVPMSDEQYLALS